MDLGNGEAFLNNFGSHNKYMPPRPRKTLGFMPRQTYGRQRSFLDQQEPIDNQLGDEELCKNSDIQQSSLSSLTLPLKRINSDISILPAIKRGGIQSNRFNPHAYSTVSNTCCQGSKEQSATLKASHELREVGQGHRFKDEIEYVMEGVRSKDKLKIRQSSCLELARLMLKKEFVEQVRTHQYMPIIFEAIHHDQDPFVFSCSILMLGIVLQDIRACNDIVAIDNLLKYLCSGLGMEMDPMALMPSTRQELTMYNDFKDIARQSGIIQKGQKVLTKSIVLSAIACLITESVSSGDIEALTVINQDPDFLHTVIELLIDDLAWIKQPSLSSGAFLPDVLDIDRIENCLRIIERLAFVSERPAASLAENTRLFPLLVQLITLCRAHSFQYPRRTDSINIMLHTLRLLVNLTNGNEPCCDKLAQSDSIHVFIQNFVQFYARCRNYNPEDIQVGIERALRTEVECRLDMRPSSRTFLLKDLALANVGANNLRTEVNGQEEKESCKNFPEIIVGDDANEWYDILLLSLALLINMLELNPVRKEELVGRDCKAIGDCFHGQCQCEKSTEVLERLVDIYNTEAIISEMTENQVLAAYLALLIGFIVAGHSESELRLYRAIAGQSLVPMLGLLNGYAALQESIEVENARRQDRIELSQTFQDESLNGSFTLAGNEYSSDSLKISFGAPRSAEVQQSFSKIIQVLQDIENRHALHKVISE
ncbi:hypothetical protein BX616_010805 [Lobosporangium transversale]|nr:hypothetical protein BX616_010805 [Lobosporangium transversale]